MKFPFFSYIILPIVLIASPLFALNNREQQLVDHVKWSIEQAEKGISKLNAQVLAVEGMTSPLIKRFLNNVCTLLNNNYLEIGVWKGSTFTAALFGNKSAIRKAVAIDNWSEFAGPAAEFKNNCKLIADVDYSFYSEDSFSINISKLFNDPVDIYFYDGNHTALSQELAFTYYNEILAPVFIAIVDDWNHGPAQVGTREAFKKLGYTIIFERELPGKHDTTLWWNGLYVAVVRK
ncbi:hypothetical protein BH09DEP1_BH09DEP1_7890 [soil metagenome]